MIALLEPIRQRYVALRADPGELRGCCGRGREGDATVAPTIRAMYDRMGFVAP